MSEYIQLNLDSKKYFVRPFKWMIHMAQCCSINIQPNLLLMKKRFCGNNLNLRMCLYQSLTVQ